MVMDGIIIVSWGKIRLMFKSYIRLHIFAIGIFYIDFFFYLNILLHPTFQFQIPEINFTRFSWINACQRTPPNPTFKHQPSYSPKKGPHSLQQSFVLFYHFRSVCPVSSFVLVIENVSQFFSGFFYRSCLPFLGLAPSSFPSNFVFIPLLSRNSSLILFKTLLAPYP